ncbi:MAG: LD-carboxypeptidase [Sumerlaeia bacterium]
MTSVLKPPHLAPGDTIALLSPAGPKPEVVDRCATVLEKEWGVTVRVGRHAREFHDYLAGTDEQRLADFNAALRDPAVRGIVCVRGGYGSSRLLRGIDWEALRRDPKPFAGFSDLTSVHGAIQTQCGQTSLHSNTIAMSFVQNPPAETARCREDMRRALFTSEPAGELVSATESWKIVGGRAKGQLVGGNLVVFGRLLATPYMPSPEGKIVFLEDVGEEGYRVDGALSQLKLSGWLERTKGVLLGQFTDSDPTEPGRLPVSAALERCLGGLKLPVLGNLPVGHIPNGVSLPLGCEVELDADAGVALALEAPFTQR